MHASFCAHEELVTPVVHTKEDSVLPSWFNSCHTLRDRRIMKRIFSSKCGSARANSRPLRSSHAVFPASVHHCSRVLQKPRQNWMSSWKLPSEAPDETSQIRSHSISNVLHSALWQPVALRVVQGTLLDLDSHTCQLQRRRCGFFQGQDSPLMVRPDVNFCKATTSFLCSHSRRDSQRTEYGLPARSILAPSAFLAHSRRAESRRAEVRRAVGSTPVVSKKS